ncbi:MAG: hypothetical protein HZA54_05435 [Planctomycetes bacterium]|nr:hypothetical protein [Planctomycetota bacterium]
MRTGFGTAAVAAAMLLGLTAGGIMADPAKADAKVDAKKVLEEGIKNAGMAAGYHFTLKVDNKALQGQGSLDASGVFKKPDVVSMKDGKLGDVVMKGKKGLVKRAGEAGWKTPEQALGPMGAMVFQVFPTPNDVLADLRAFASGAEAKGEESAGGVDCTLIEMNATPEQIKAYVTKQLGRLGPMGGMVRPDAFDLKAAKLSYKVWVGKEDKRVHKVLNSAQIPPGKQAGGNAKNPFGSISLDSETAVEYTDFDKDLDVKFDDEVKQKLGVK